MRIYDLSMDSMVYHPKKTNLLERVPAVFLVRFSAMAQLDLVNEKQMSIGEIFEINECRLPPRQCHQGKERRSL